MTRRAQFSSTMITCPITADTEESDELDSFMYQTVGHDGIAVISECMGLPLFRRPVRYPRLWQHNVRTHTHKPFRK